MLSVHEAPSTCIHIHVPVVPILPKLSLYTQTMRPCLYQFCLVSSHSLHYWILLSTYTDIYHRILRFKNYMIAMVNKDLLPLKFNLPFLGERFVAVHISSLLKLCSSLRLLFAWSPVVSSSVSSSQLVWNTIWRCCYSVSFLITDVTSMWDILPKHSLFSLYDNPFRGTMGTFWEQLASASRVQEPSPSSKAGSDVSPLKSPFHFNVCALHERVYTLRRLSKRILWVGIANFILCPVIFLWQILYSFFRYAEVSCISIFSCSWGMAWNSPVIKYSHRIWCHSQVTIYSILTGAEERARLLGIQTLVSLCPALSSSFQWIRPWIQCQVGSLFFVFRTSKLCNLPMNCYHILWNKLSNLWVVDTAYPLTSCALCKAFSIFCHRLCRAYKPAEKYMNIFTSPVVVIIAKWVALLS